MCALDDDVFGRKDKLKVCTWIIQLKDIYVSISCLKKSNIFSKQMECNSFTLKHIIKKYALWRIPFFNIDKLNLFSMFDFVNIFHIWERKKKKKGGAFSITHIHKFLLLCGPCKIVLCELKGAPCISFKNNNKRIYIQN